MAAPLLAGAVKEIVALSAPVAVTEEIVGASGTWAQIGVTERFNGVSRFGLVPQ